MLGLAIAFITLALVFYTIGVWGEKIQHILKKRHLIAFWLGFACDTMGTSFMKVTADQSGIGGLNFHAISGMIAILLMLFHAIWATVVMLKKNENMMKSFHKLSLIVWLIWLIPYLSGMIAGMQR